MKWKLSSSKKENTGNMQDEADYSRGATTGTEFPSFLKINLELRVHKPDSGVGIQKAVTCMPEIFIIEVWSCNTHSDISENGLCCAMN